MEHATSADGTRIAFDRHGDGDPVVIVGGAMSTAAAGTPLAEALAESGLQGVTIDRRARGDSGDTSPYSPVREVEDLAAVIDAVGGRAAVLGHSSGAVLALFAAGRGVPITNLFLSEPPFSFGESGQAQTMPERLQSLVDDGENAEVVLVFQREVVGLPAEVIDQIRNSPMFDELAKLAQSIVYDSTLTREVSEPDQAMREVRMPVTILRGDPTSPFLVRACELLHEALPESELLIVPESQNHGLDPVGTAREVRVRLTARE